MEHRLPIPLLTVLLGVLLFLPVRAGGTAAVKLPALPVPSPVVDDAEDEAPYTLSAAYPNPFYSRTQFDLRVEETQQVSVEVYNILGQRVRTLYRGVMQANDTRTFVLKARELPPGLYLYRISGETFNAARRVTLVR